MTAPASPRDSAPTLEDVARAAGVSLATASRVLNGSTRRVAESFRDKVQTAAADLGYSANLSAQATARGTSNAVSLLVADIADPYFGQIAAGVSRGAAEAGLLVTIGVTGRDIEREVAQLRALRGQRPRAVILATSRTGDAPSPELQRELNAIQATGSRVVALGPGAGEVPSVLIDNVEGARELGRSLARRGYRAALILAGDEGARTSDDRVAGFTAGFTAAGGEVVRIVRGGFSREAGERMLRAAVRDGVPEGTVVFGVSDVVALGAMAAARAMGRAVGSDLAVAGFDDVPTAADVTPALTTVHVPLEEVGYLAIRVALDDAPSGVTLAPPLEVVLRDSTPQRS